MHTMDFYLRIFSSRAFSPSLVKHASRAFSPLPAEHAQSLGLVVVKGHAAAHVPDVNQRRKQSTQLQKNLTQPRKEKNI